ncbi:MAG: hypothetical protein Kow0040_09990 [Thermogutta sp.]
MRGLRDGKPIPAAIPPGGWASGDSFESWESTAGIGWEGWAVRWFLTQSKGHFYS